MPKKKWTPPKQTEIDIWDGGAGEPLYTKEVWDRLREEAGTKDIDYAAINIAAQVERLVEKFGYEEAAQVARGTAYAFGVREEKGPQQDWLEVERLILERHIVELANK